MNSHSLLRSYLQKQKAPLIAEPMYSIGEAANLLGIGTLALRRATKKGLIHAVRLHARGHFKYRESELRKFLEPRSE